MQLIDTHTHLYDISFEEDIDLVIERAQAHNVNKMLLPNCDAETMKSMLALHKRFPQKCLPMIGLHPCYVKENYLEELDTILKYRQEADYVAVGEIGLDYYWDKTFVQQQKEAFDIQMDWAIDMNLPIVIHTRDSLDDGISMVEEKQNGKLSGVFHCFGGDETQARRIIDCGFKLGIGGVLTFKNSTLKDWITSIPLENILLETDAPYLAPVPYRGKRNESAYVYHVAEFLAGLYNLSIDEVAEITTINAKKLFNI